MLVEDTSLTFNALGSLPGPLIKWFLESLGNDGMATLLDGYKDRSARAEVCFAICDKDEVKIFKGAISGTIAKEPRGAKGFGWDPTFIPEGYELTWGEMDAEQQKETSMRRIALKRLEAHVSGR